MSVIFDGVPDTYHDTYLSYFDLEHYRKKFKHPKPGFRIAYAREHPVTFAYFMLGKKIRPYQAFAIDKILEEQKVGLCWSRRLGKSTILGLIALWACWFDLYPKNKIQNYTEIGIISKEEKAAKDLLHSIKLLIYEGDTHMAKILVGKNNRLITTYFSEKLGEPTNVEQITFDNRCIIKSYPPTKKVRGNGFSMLFIDEVAFLNPPDETPTNFYYGAALPTIAETGGKVVIASTPNGIANMFYDLFDPNGEKESPFTGIHFTWKINKSNDTYRMFVEDQEKDMRNKGQERLFDQEYMAEFVTSQESFFLPDDLEQLFDSKEGMVRYDWKTTPCSIGIDYGVTTALTVVTVTTFVEGMIQILFQRAFPPGWDINKLLDDSQEDGIPDLMKRYSVHHLVPDDCAQANSSITLMKNKAWPVQEFSFQNVTDKNRAYYTFRNLMRAGKLKCYPNEEFLRDCRGIQEEIKIRHVIIGKSGSSKDDRVDSAILSVIPFFEGRTGSFGIASYKPDIKKEKEADPRRDPVWDRMYAQQKKEGLV